MASSRKSFYDKEDRVFRVDNALRENPEPSNPFLVQDFPKIRLASKMGAGAAGCWVPVAQIFLEVKVANLV